MPVLHMMQIIKSQSKEIDELKERIRGKNEVIRRQESAFGDIKTQNSDLSMRLQSEMTAKATEQQRVEVDIETFLFCLFLVSSSSSIICHMVRGLPVFNYGMFCCLQLLTREVEAGKEKIAASLEALERNKEVRHAFHLLCTIFCDEDLCVMLFRSSIT